MLSTAQLQSRPVYLSDWTMNSVISMTYFEKEKHFLKYTIVRENEAAYAFNPPIACVKQGFPKAGLLLRQTVGIAVHALYVPVAGLVASSRLGPPLCPHVMTQCAHPVPPLSRL